MRSAAPKVEKTVKKQTANGKPPKFSKKYIFKIQNEERGKVLNIKLSNFALEVDEIEQFWPSKFMGADFPSYAHLQIFKKLPMLLKTSTHQKGGPNLFKNRIFELKSVDDAILLHFGF